MYILLVVLLPANSLPPVTVNPEMCCRLMGISLELDAIMLSPIKMVGRRSREVKWEEIAHQVEEMELWGNVVGISLIFKS